MTEPLNSTCICGQPGTDDDPLVVVYFRQLGTDVWDTSHRSHLTVSVTGEPCEPWAREVGAA